MVNVPSIWKRPSFLVRFSLVFHTRSRPYLTVQMNSLIVYSIASQGQSKYQIMNGIVLIGMSLPLCFVPLKMIGCLSTQRSIAEHRGRGKHYNTRILSHLPHS